MFGAAIYTKVGTFLFQEAALALLGDAERLFSKKEVWWNTARAHRQSGGH